MERIQYLYQQILQRHKDLLTSYDKMAMQMKDFMKDVIKNWRETSQAADEEGREGEGAQEGCEMKNKIFKIKGGLGTRRAGARNQGDKDINKFGRYPGKVHKIKQNNLFFLKNLYLKGGKFEWMVSVDLLISGEVKRIGKNKPERGQAFSGHRINPPGGEG